MQIFINTPGSYLHVKDEMFEIRQTKEGQEEKHQIAAHKVTTIVLPKSAALSTDAIHLALKFNIDIVVIHNNGHPAGRFWHSKLGSTTKIRKAQLEASLSEVGLHWVKDWILKKIENQAEFLESLTKHRNTIVDYLRAQADKIRSQGIKISGLTGASTAEVADTIRGLEGTAGRLYFEALNEAMPEAYKFSGRSSRPAKDPFNAFLNYAYGILYSRIERALMLAGVDPYVGFLHRDDYNQLSMVFDFIEPYRIHAETAVFRLFTSKKVNKSCTDEITNGYSLNDEGKKMLAEHFIDYLDNQTIRHNGRNLSRMHAMQLDAHQFANKLIGKA
ncbi:MAG: CRISPR-associated endonuclease Cas1 [Cyclobacteriaceae bacterium]